MFNFDLQNRAFKELNTTQFKLFYLINNTLSVSKTDSLEMYNNYIMKHMGLSERMVQYNIKALEQLGYITVERAKKRNTPNIISLVKGAENCTPTDKEPQKEVQSITKNNASINCTLYNTKDNNNLRFKDMTIDMKPEDMNDKIDVKASCERSDLPSSKLEDKVTGGSVYIPKNHEVNSPTSHSEDDMTFEEFTEMDLKRRGITPITSNKITASFKNAPGGAGCVEIRSMGSQSIRVEKTQQDAHEATKTEHETTVASIMKNIDLDKDGMFHAQSQMQFDACFEDFKTRMGQMKALVSAEAYDNYRSQQGKWWRATEKYMKYYNKLKKQQSNKLTDEDMSDYRYRYEGMKIAKTVEDMDKALNHINNFFNRMAQKYPENVMTKVYEGFETDCGRISSINPIFNEWQKTQEEKTGD